MAIVLALVAIGASPRHRVPDAITPDAVIQHLNVVSFMNRGVRDGHTFADNGFAVVRKDENSATLFRKRDHLTKTFEILAVDSRSVRLCLHDQWVVMPNSPQPMRFDYTYAVMVWREKGRFWNAEIAPGGFMGCINNPSFQSDRRPPPAPPSDIRGLIQSAFPLRHSVKN